MTSLRHSKLSAILVVAPVCIVSLVGRGWGAVVLLVKIHISCAENCNKYFFSCGILMMVLVVSVTWVRTIPVFTNRGRPEFAYELGTVGWSQWEKESMVVLSSWLRLNKAEFHHGLHSIESSFWCVIFCVIINCCRPVAEWHDQHFDHSWARHSCGPAPGAQMVSWSLHYKQSQPLSLLPKAANAMFKIEPGEKVISPKGCLTQPRPAHQFAAATGWVWRPADSSWQLGSGTETIMAKEGKK